MSLSFPQLIIAPLHFPYHFFAHTTPNIKPRAVGKNRCFFSSEAIAGRPGAFSVPVFFSPMAGVPGPRVADGGDAIAFSESAAGSGSSPAAPPRLRTKFPESWIWFDEATNK
jgi:hypothetical protein